MTPKQAKALGYKTEAHVEQWLRTHGWPLAERRRLRGHHDQGDITGTPALAWECKSSLSEVAEAVREAEKERDHAGADYGLVVMRRRGTADVGRWYCVLTMDDVARLLHAAGYGDAPEVAA